MSKGNKSDILPSLPNKLEQIKAKLYGLDKFFSRNNRGKSRAGEIGRSCRLRYPSQSSRSPSFCLLADSSHKIKKVVINSKDLDFCLLNIMSRMA